MKAVITIVVIILIIIVGVALVHKTPSAPVDNGTATTTDNMSSTTDTTGSTTTGTSTGTTTGTTASTSQTISDGVITFSAAPGFAVATTRDQISVKSYIPPCTDDFNYCVYYNGNAYKGTNFESAGLAIAKRADLSTEQVCLNTPPSGYSTSTAPVTHTASGYSTAIFKDVGDAAAGNYSKAIVHRLFIKPTSACYQFITQIGLTRAENYPAGSIKALSDTDINDIMSKLLKILAGVKLVKGVGSNFFQGQ